MAACRVCLDSEPAYTLYSLPCFCRGSVSVIHEECFAVWMLRQHNESRPLRCDVCHHPFYIVEFDGNYCFLAYHVTFFVLYYLIFVFATIVYWASSLSSNFTSVQCRFNDVILLLLLFFVFHPVLVTTACVAYFVHQHISLRRVTFDQHEQFVTFLQTHGTKV